MTSYFVVGTDTGVGKTHVTAALLAAARGSSSSACVLKPVQTGAPVQADGHLSSPDVDLCLAAAGWDAPPAVRATFCPYAFPLAASPHLAASAAGVEIDLHALVEKYRGLRRSYDTVLVEGAGGLLVPLHARETVADLIARLDLPVVVVARPGLGTLNHTLLTCEELQRRGLRLAAVVLSERPDASWGRIEEDNLATLRHYLGQRVLRFPALPPPPDARWLAAGVALEQALHAPA